MFPEMLTGIRVLDLTVALSGPFATLALADLGADVIRIEAPGGGGDISRLNPPYIGAGGLHFDSPGADDMSLSTINRSRGKKSVTLNLKTDEGRDLFFGLLRSADVVVENFSEGTADRLGVGFDAVHSVEPRVVYCSISGFGEHHGDYPGVKAMDIAVQAVSGVMETSGNRGEPPVRVGIPIGDLTGSLYGVIGVLAALHERDRTGVGRRVQVSLLDALVALLTVEHFDAYERSGIETRTGNAHARLAPFGVYAATDGYVAIAAHTDEWFSALMAVMERDDLLADQRFAGRGTRIKHVDALNAEIEAWTGRHTSEDVVRLVHATAGVPCVAVRGPLEAAADPAVVSQGAVIELEHPRFGRIGGPLKGTGLPIRFSGLEPVGGRPAPTLGEHTTEVLGELGLTASDLASLAERGVI